MSDEAGSGGCDNGGGDNGASAAGTEHVVASSGDFCQEPIGSAVTNANHGDDENGGEDEKTKDISNPEGTVHLEMDNTEHTVVHFHELTTATVDSRPECKTTFGKIYRWWDCDMVWIGFLLLGTVVALALFIAFIALSASGDKEVINPQRTGLNLNYTE